MSTQQTLYYENYTSPLQSFSEHAPSFNYRISMDTKSPITPSSQNKSYIHVIVDAFSHFVVTGPNKSNNAKTAVKTLLHHRVVKFGPPTYLVTDRGSEYISADMHVFVHLWVLDTLLKHLIPLGLMDSLKYKTKTLVHSFVCFYKTLLRIGHIKFICTLLHTIHNPTQCFTT